MSYFRGLSGVTAKHPSNHTRGWMPRYPFPGGIMFKYLIRRLFAVIGITVLVVGLMGFQPANADTTADFTAWWSSNTSANAEATGVSIAGADATGKILLEEERATMSERDIKRMKPPTKAEITRYGVVVHSMDQAQSVATKQITAYDKLVHNASLKVKKLQVRLKYADSAKEKRVLKQKLRHARNHLKAITKDESWKYRPLIRMVDGCFRNTGRRDNMVLQSFVECVEGNKAEVDLGFDPMERKMRVVGVIFTDGTMKDLPCENFAFFDIPEGTPNEDMVIVVTSFAKVVLTVGVGVHVVGDLTIYGVMKQDGKTCDEEIQVVHVDRFISVPPVTVTATDTDQALAFGQQQVQADATARAEVQKAVEAQLQTDVSRTMHLQCASESPKGTVAIDRMNDLNQSTIDSSGNLHKSQSPNEIDYMVPAGQQAILRIDCGSCSSVVFTSNGSKTLTVTGDGKLHTVQVLYTASTEPGTDTMTVTNTVSGQSPISATTPSFMINKVVAPPK